MEIVNKSKNLATKLSRCEVIEEIVNKHLRSLEEKGIETLEGGQTPSGVLAHIRDFRDKIILESLKDALGEARTKPETAKTPKAKVNAYSRILQEIAKFKDKVSDPGAIAGVESEVKGLIGQKEKPKEQNIIYIMKKLGRFIKEKREAMDLSLRDASKLSGVSHTHIRGIHIRGIEDGRSIPSFEMVSSSLRQSTKDFAIPCLRRWSPIARQYADRQQPWRKWPAINACRSIRLTVDGIAETLHTALPMNETNREALISSAKEWSKRFMHDPGADFALVLERLRKA